MKHTFSHLFRLFLPVWLAIAPAMVSAHETDHAFSLTPEETVCAICQLGDRDDDFVVPDFVLVIPAAQPQQAEAPKPRPADGRIEGEKPIRGPPAAS